MILLLTANAPERFSGYSEGSLGARNFAKHTRQKDTLIILGLIIVDYCDIGTCIDKSIACMFASTLAVTMQAQELTIMAVKPNRPAAGNGTPGVTAASNSPGFNHGIHIEHSE